MRLSIDGDVVINGLSVYGVLAITGKEMLTDGRSLFGGAVAAVALAYWNGVSTASLSWNGLIPGKWNGVSWS